MKGSCVEWGGRRNETGYGIDGNRRAHRVAWEREHGPIPQGLCVLHRCDNRACVNPEHLFLGTQLDNIADREAKGRGVPPPSRKKLTDADVAEMRRLYRRYDRSGGWTQARLAERFGVSRGHVSRLVNGFHYPEAPV